MAKWIWNDLNVRDDDYGVFTSTFESKTGKISLDISSDTDYAVYINKKLYAFGQYPTFPWHPVLDTINGRCKKGLNELKIIVYYCGSERFSTYYSEHKPGLYFVIKEDDKVLLESNENILSTRSLVYESGHEEIITPQLGYRMFYDARKENKKLDYHKSIIQDKCLDFTPRPLQKTKLLNRVDVKYLKKEKNHVLIDLGKEMTGFVDLDFISKHVQTVKVCWGEHLVDGGVRYSIDNRRFVTTYIAKRGHNKFMSTFRRYGLRYLELFFEDDIDIKYIGLRPVFYPFKVRKWHIDDPLRAKIYETAIYTLECCFHEHFEDCPWREQSFYVLDSRNQIYYHTYAFKNNETLKSAIHLVNQSRRDDGIFGITIPSNMKFTIPSYSLFFVEFVYAYAKKFKDKKVFIDTYDRINEMLKAFSNRIEKGILKNWIGDDYWNFYEWVPGLDYPSKEVTEDLLLNTIYLNQLDFFKKICKEINKPFEFDKDIKVLKKGIKKYFYNKEKGLFIHTRTNPKYYAYGNSMAILANLCNKKEAERILDQLISDKEVIQSSISMRVFMYDAMVKINKAKYKDFILNDIDKAFKRELELGATTFWETEDGEKDFFGAGSLCHAWCSLAIEYYNIYGVVKKN